MVRPIQRLHTIVAAAVLIVVLASGMRVRAQTTSGDVRPPITFTSPNSQDSGGFGHDVAVSDDIEVVGAESESGGAGSAYIFDAPTGTLIASLTSPNGGGLFSDSVAVSGHTVAVGAPFETAGGFSSAGHAYLFSTTGSLITTLTSPNPQPGGEFSFVAVSSTGIVVGAPGETAGGFSLAGHTYVFNTAGSLITTLTSPNPQFDGFFGNHVAISGGNVFVGAPGENGFAGHVYVFSTTGSLISSLASPSPQAGGQFGFSVAVSGYNLVVGAAGETAGGFSRAGHAYVFDASAGTLIATLTSPNAQSGLFGLSVGVSGTNVVIGAPLESAGGFSAAGHAYLFSTTGSLIATLASPNAQASGEFGRGVADDDAPDRTTVLVGAPNETAGGFNRAGHAYLYVRLKT